MCLCDWLIHETQSRLNNEATYERLIEINVCLLARVFLLFIFFCGNNDISYCVHCSSFIVSVWALIER